MADQLKLRGGSEDASKNFTGAAREVTVDTTDWTLRVHDGVTAGGHKLLKSGSCLVVEEADKCDPTKPTCKVTVNGDLEVSGDVTIDGNIDLGDIVVDLESDDVTLKSPGDFTFDCNVPDANNQKTQADANKTFFNGIRILDEKLCIAQKEIQVLEAQYQQLENRVEQNEIDIAALKVEIADLKQEIIDLENAIKLLEVEIENNANAILAHEGRISSLEAKVDQINIEIEDLKDALTNLKLNDLADCAVPNPKDGQQLVFRNGQWVAEDDAFSSQAVHFMGFVNVEDDTAPTGGDVKPGDTYIQHKVDETVATANSTWTGIVGEQVAEGQYVMYGADLKWHKGKTVENVDQIQSDWAETDVASPAFIKSKPTEFPPEAHGHAWGEITGKPTEFPPSSHTHSYNDLTDKPTIGDGKLTIKNSDGTTAGSFKANQAGNTEVTLPVSSNVNDAPNDGEAYVRLNKDWEKLVHTPDAFSNVRGIVLTQIDNFNVNTSQIYITNTKVYVHPSYENDQVFNVPNYGYINFNECRMQISKIEIDSGYLVLSHFGFCGGPSGIPNPGAKVNVFNDSTPTPSPGPTVYRSFPEAPSTGSQYVRQNEDWVEIEIDPDAAFPEAPSDSYIYARDGKNKVWVKALPYDLSKLPLL